MLFVYQIQILLRSYTKFFYFYLNKISLKPYSIGYCNVFLPDLQHHFDYDFDTVSLILNFRIDIVSVYGIIMNIYDIQILPLLGFELIIYSGTLPAELGDALFLDIHFSILLMYCSHMYSFYF